MSRKPTHEIDKVLANAIAGIRPLRLDDLSFFFLNSTRDERVECRGSRIEYRFDEDRKMIYQERKFYNNLYTYIAKSTLYDGVYKIGRSSDIHERMKSLNGKSNIYGRLAFEPIAFYVGDIEFLILSALRPARPEKLPPQFNGAKEVVFVSKADMDYVIDSVGFTRCSTATLPSELTKTIRYYYDNEGWAVERIEELSFIDHTGTEVRKKKVVPYLEEDEYLERTRGDGIVVSRYLDEEDD